MHSLNEGQLQKLRDHVILALDVEEMDDALKLVDRMSDYLTRVKVGSRLFTRCGPALMEALSERGVQIFLDLKFHDIPHTVAGAVESAAGFESVFMLTVHAAGGQKMLESAVQAAAAARAQRDLKLVAITALTSLTPDDLAETGITSPLNQWATQLGALAVNAGADGLVCSAHEARALRARFGDTITLVTPGIRPTPRVMRDDGSVENDAGRGPAENSSIHEQNSEKYDENFAAPHGARHHGKRPGSASIDDQARIMTPRAALDAGSNFLVIGRPIYQSPDPLAALKAIGESL